MDGMNQSNEKIQQVDRLVMTIAKRKRTMPQKFLGSFMALKRLTVVINPVKSEGKCVFPTLCQIVDGLSIVYLRTFM